MTCQTYIEEYLAAHADSELDGQAQSLADQHIGDCLRCRERFISERRLKTLIRTHSTIAKVSADVQLRIRAALGELVEADSRPAVRPGSADRGARRGVRVGVWTRVRSVKLGARAKIALPVAALGSLIVMLSLFAGHLRTGTTLSVVPPTQLFDLAVSKFNDFGQTFVANATDQAANRHDDSYYAWVMERDGGSPLAGESADLARSYREANIPEEIFDFGGSGYGLYGGRIEQAAGPSAGANQVTYTLYRGERGQILSVCLHAPGFAAPIGARYWVGPHTFYVYKGHSICLTFHPQGHFVSILVAREPVIDLLRDVTLADQTAQAS